MKNLNVFGINLTQYQDMMFWKYLKNNPLIKSPNTLTEEGRKSLVLDFLKKYKK